MDTRAEEAEAKKNAEEKKIQSKAITGADTKKPLRIKVRNISGDESIHVVNLKEEK